MSGHGMTPWGRQSSLLPAEELSPLAGRQFSFKKKSAHPPAWKSGSAAEQQSPFQIKNLNPSLWPVWWILSV